MPRCSVISATLLAAALAASLAACGGGSSDAKGGDSGGSGSLSLATVQKETPEKDFMDNCPYGGWEENSTGVDEEFRDGVKFFRQYDCTKVPLDKAESLSDYGALQIVEYVEFDTEAHAKAFVEGNLTYASQMHLRDGTKVLSVGMGLGSIPDADAKAYLDKVSKACGCGEITAGKDS